MIGITIAPLGEPAPAVAWAAARGIRGVQWSATQAGMRPRELGASARRDIRALLVRHEMVLAGVDAIVPPAHLVDAQHAERALDAIRAACEFAADLGRPAVTVQLPEQGDAAPAQEARRAAVDALVAIADRSGVAIADLAGGALAPSPPIGVAIDPAAVLAAGDDPAAAVSRAGHRLLAARLVDLSRSGMRGPVGGGPGARLDLLAYRVALGISGFSGLPVVDCRQWADPRAGVEASVAAWAALG